MPTIQFDMKQLTVQLDTFSSTVRRFELGDLAATPPGTGSGNILWVTDSRVWEALAGPRSTQEIRQAMSPLMHNNDRDLATAPVSTQIPRPGKNVLTIAAGEENKTWEQVSAIINFGFSLGLARDGCIIGLGGGVVCDMAAFAASLYMRGCKLVLIPSTLLAMVDAALGGKTGINFGGFKNMVGTFYPATEIRIIPELNQTLPEKEYRSGLGEVIKHAFLADPVLLEMLKNNRTQVLAREKSALDELVWKSLLVKARIIEQDFREQSIRAHLNLGHTFAHGLESAAGFGMWTHGEAVAWGMVKAAQLSCRLGASSPEFMQEVINLIDSYGYRTKAEDVSVDALIKAMLMDKKKQSGGVRFVLQKAMGDTFMQPVSETDLRAVLSEN